MTKKKVTYVFLGVILTILLCLGYMGLFNKLTESNIDISNIEFSIIADSFDSSGLDLNSGFIITSDYDYALADVEAAIKVSPQFDYNINKAGHGRYYMKPEAQLMSNSIYNIYVQNTDNIPDFSWAFQTKGNFSVLSSSPANNSVCMNLDTGIQINFSKSLFMKSFKKSLIIVELLSAMVIALVLAFYQDKYWIAILVGAIMVLYPVATYFLFYRNLMKTADDKTNGFEDIDCEFIIEENKFRAILKFDGMENVLENDYSSFIQIIETKELFVMVLPNQQGYFVEKKGFLSEGDLERASNLFRGLLGYKKI